MTRKQKLLEQLSADLDVFEKDMIEITNRSEKIYNKTSKVIKTVFSIIGFLVVLNLYYIYDFAKDVVLMTQYMEEMYTHFGNVTQNVSYMNRDVKHMGSNIKLMPKLADKMVSMNQHVGKMSQNVHTMRVDVTSMNNDVKTINQDMGNMSIRFDNVNRSVSGMGYNVNQMSDVIPR